MSETPYQAADEGPFQGQPTGKRYQPVPGDEMPGESGNPSGGSFGGAPLNERFPTHPEQLQPQWVLAFIIQVTTVAFLTLLGINDIIIPVGWSVHNPVGPGILTTCYLSVMLSIVWFFLFVYYTHFFVVGLNLFACVLCGLQTCIYIFIDIPTESFLLLPTLILFTAVYCWWYFTNLSRFPAAANLLKHTGDLLTQYQGLVLIWCIGLLVQFFYLALVYRQSAKLSGWFVLLMTIPTMWTFEMVQGIVGTIVAGAVGIWYYLGDEYPDDPTQEAAKRVLGNCLGAISMGSLLVPYAKLCSFLISFCEAYEYMVPELISRLGPFLQMLESFADEYSYFGFTHVAIYCKPFNHAARDASEVVRKQGLTQLLGQTLIIPMMALMTLTGGLIIGFIVAASHNGGFWIYWVASSAILGVTSSVITSAVATIFVCYAEEPEALRGTHPALYDKIANPGDWGLETPSAA